MLDTKPPIEIRDSEEGAIFVRRLPSTRKHPPKLVALDKHGNQHTVIAQTPQHTPRPNHADRAVAGLCAKMGWTGKLLRGGGDGKRYVAVYVWEVLS